MSHIDVDPVTVTVRGARAALGLGNTKIYELIGSGDLETVTIGRRRLVKFSSIRALIERAAVEQKLAA